MNCKGWTALVHKPIEERPSILADDRCDQLHVSIIELRLGLRSGSAQPLLAE
jgi:hypothetical protein